MSTTFGRKLIYAPVLIVLLFLVQGMAATIPDSAPLTADQVVARMMEMDAHRAALTVTYRGVRRYTLDYKGFSGEKHAEMVVQVLATPPQKELTIVSESGSKFLLTHVLRKLIESEREAADGKNRKEVKLTPENYNFELKGTETVEDRPCYVLQVVPKRDNKFLYKGKVWIDAEDFAVTRISASPAKNPSFWISSVQIEHQYQKHDELWLPRSNRSSTKVRLGGRGLLTIDYQQYEFPDSNAASATPGQKP